MAYEARLDIGIDSRGAKREVDGVGRSLDGMEKSGNRASKSAKGTTLQLNAMRAAAAGLGSILFGTVIKQTANFEQAMLGVRAVTGATGEQFEELTKQARELGAVSVFSAQQAAEAQKFLAQAGFDTNEVLAATPGILQLATAASLDLGTAADLASNALSGFRLNVDQLGRVNDVLAKTASSANTDVSQLGQALSFAAPIASSAGVSIEQASAAIGALSDAGLQASRAGTGFVGFIRQLSNLTPNAASALARYNLTLKDVDITTRGLQPVIDDLAAANISTADAFQIFGSEAGAAAQILLASSERVSSLTGELQDAEGAAEGMAAILGSGLTSSMKSFQSATAEAVLQVGEGGLGGAFRSLIDTATGVISAYNGMLPQFAEANNLTQEQTRNVQSLATALKVVGGAAAGYLALTSAIKAAAIAQAAFNAAARANPYILIATAVGAATVAIYEFVTAQDNALNAQERLWEDATKSSAAYQVAQSRIADGQRLNDELMAEQIKKQEQLNQLQENGFKRYGSGATKAAKLEREILEIEEKRRRLSQLRMDADKAEMDRRNKAKQEQLELEKQLKQVQGLGEDSDMAAQMKEESEALDRLVASATAYTRQRRDAIEAEKALQERREQELNSVRQSLFTEEEAIEASYQRRLEIVRRNLGEQSDLERQLTEQRNDQLLHLERQRQRMILTASADLFGNLSDLAEAFGDKQSDTYKSLFALSKSFAIADAGLRFSMALGQAMADPTAITLPQKIGNYAAVASTMGQLLNSLQGVNFAGAFDKGGSIPSGKWGIAGEFGPEIIQGPAKVTSRKDTEKMMGGGGTVVNIHNAPAGTRTERRKSVDGQEFVDVFIADVEGDGPMFRALSSRTGLQRRGA